MEHMDQDQAVSCPLSASLSTISVLTWPPPLSACLGGGQVRGASRAMCLCNEAWPPLPSPVPPPGKMYKSYPGLCLSSVLIINFLRLKSRENYCLRALRRECLNRNKLLESLSGLQKYSQSDIKTFICYISLSDCPDVPRPCPAPLQHSPC